MRRIPRGRLVVRNEYVVVRVAVQVVVPGDVDIVSRGEIEGQVRGQGDGVGVVAIPAHHPDPVVVIVEHRADADGLHRVMGFGGGRELRAVVGVADVAGDRARIRRHPDGSAAPDRVRTRPDLATLDVVAGVAVLSEVVRGISPRRPTEDDRRCEQHREVQHRLPPGPIAHQRYPHRRHVSRTPHVVRITRPNCFSRASPYLWHCAQSAVGVPAE